MNAREPGPGEAQPQEAAPTRSSARVASPISDPRTVRYELSVPEPARHVVSVRASYGALGARDALVLVLPVWAPGSYKVRDFSKQVQDLTARNESRQPLVATKVRKNAWRIERSGAQRIDVSYAVYGFELSVRTNHVDDRHAFVNGTNTFFFVEGELDRPALLEVSPPEGWEVACALDPAPSSSLGKNAYVARDYDQLADSPLELGKLERLAFEHAGVRHEVAISGEGNRPARQWVEDLRKLVALEVALVGELPCPRYTFIVHLFARGQGGLEHKDSTAVQYPRARLKKKKDYERFLSLLAHEYFHLWNGKRIRPAPLGPFDYDREVHTRCLWLVEGVTAYYDELLLARAGLVTGDRYLEMQAERIRSLLDTPGRARQSLADASFDAWIKYYQRDENSPNSQVSYYEKGQLVAMLLDLEMRARTRSRRSLDDVVRALWENHGKKDLGYREPELAPLFSSVAGFDLEPFFRSFIGGTDEPDWDRFLAHAGLELKPAKKKKDDPPKVRLGVLTEKKDGRVELSSVLEGTPAFEAGLSAKDEIVAIEGRRLTADTFEERLQDFSPGERVRFTVFRDDDIREVVVLLGDGSALPARIVRKKDATEEQRALYESWLGRPWEEKEEEEPEAAAK
ncbi:M61 family metallopeptidase [bacterium]|nr:M61 family metallopeptidase [bacterium]